MAGGRDAFWYGLCEFLRSFWAGTNFSADFDLTKPTGVSYARLNFLDWEQAYAEDGHAAEDCHGHCHIVLNEQIFTVKAPTKSIMSLDLNILSGMVMFASYL